MGKGDRRTRKGKFFTNSYGKKRKRKEKKRIVITPKEVFENNSNDKGVIGEKIVNYLSFNSYLKYWCYPNPTDLNGEKKEICDLLILFFDTAIIISVKNYNLKGNYNRFVKKVIDKSTKQLFGAQRKLFNSKREIRISHPEKGEEIFIPDQYKSIFRITVSVGEDFENYKFIDSKEGKGIVNIFNKETFSIITSEFDTIKDLVEYLKARELILLKNRDKIMNCDEKDLIAYFLLNKRIFDQSLVDNFETKTSELKNKWNFYISNTSVYLKKMADKKSYFIDNLIKKDVLKISNGELLAKELMTLSRFERRIIATHIFEVVEKYQEKTDFLARRFFIYNDIGFLFIYYPLERSQSEVDYVLKKASDIYSYKHDSEKIVLLAATKYLKQWKFLLYQGLPLTQRMKNNLDFQIKEFGWFQDEKKTDWIIKEYPDEK